VIRGVGIDIIENVRIKRIFSRFGYSFAKKILSTNELKEFTHVRKKIDFLAKRFASKEALSKSIGIGLYRQGLSPSIIDIKKDDLGKPSILLNKELKTILKKYSISRLHLSVSDTDDLSTAIVIAEGE
tara:strand:+ start:196 stop:579 length:384 start_codon:yes stop_codon:yes gene_type:complete